MSCRKQALGDQRYAEYQRSKDYNYRELLRFTQQQELPSDVAAKIYDMSMAARQQTGNVLRDANLSAEQRQAAIEAIRSETLKAMQNTMGEQNFKSLQRTRGYLLQNFVR